MIHARSPNGHPRLAKVRLNAEQLEQLRKFYAAHGPRGAVAKLRSSRETVGALISGGPARQEVIDRLFENLARAS